MRIARVASWLHKWLGLIVGVQVVFWFVSGLFFALAPIERVRSEHRIAAHEHRLELSGAPTPADIAALLPEHPQRLNYESDATGASVAVAEFAERRPITIDLATGQARGELARDHAVAIARAHIGAELPVKSAALLTEASPEYRGALPAWRIAFEDREGLAVYVAVDTGRVMARRSDLWRVYDALWALHIMDWRDHENFNTGLLIVTTALALVLAIAGVVLLPYRIALRKR